VNLAANKKENPDCGVRAKLASDATGHHKGGRDRPQVVRRMAIEPPFKVARSDAQHKNAAAAKVLCAEI